MLSVKTLFLQYVQKYELYAISAIRAIYATWCTILHRILHQLLDVHIVQQHCTSILCSNNCATWLVILLLSSSSRIAHIIARYIAPFFTLSYIILHVLSVFHINYISVQHSTTLHVLVVLQKPRIVYTQTRFNDFQKRQELWVEDRVRQLPQSFNGP